jgi:3-hydroxybutyryl-CoA dehydrogenase
MASKIGVIGAGIMGCDISINLAVFGFEVLLVDVDDHALEKSKDRISKSLQLYRMMREEYRQYSVDAILSKIFFTKQLDLLKDSETIVENISEDMDAKAQLYKKLNTILREDVLIGVNTSCIPIQKIASVIENPQRVVGMHFMNPVPMKDVVEVVRSRYNNQENINQAKSFLKSINKTAIVVNDSPGFVANRLSHLFMNEAACLVQEKVASPAEIDLLFKKGYGHSMGPLETADLIGIDTVVNSLGVLHQNFNDPKYLSCELLKTMMKDGLLGRKTGQGFYKYS